MAIGDVKAKLSGSSAAASSAADADADADAAPKAPRVSFLQLFRYTTRREKAYMALGCLAAAVHGALLPVWTIFFGGVIEEFGLAQGDGDEGIARVVDAIGGQAKWFLILGGIAFFMSFLQVRFQMIVATRTGIRIRKLYFKSLMRQNFSWYDAENSGELTTRVAGDVDLIQAGIGDKLGSAVQFIAQGVVGVGISFFYSWKLTLVILAVAPLLAACGAVFAKLSADSTSEGQGAYGGAGAVAAEVISLIRTVHAFGGEEEEAARYDAELDAAYKSGAKKGFFNGLGLGITMFLIFCAYSLCFWFGAKLIRDDEIGTKNLFIAFFSTLMGAMGLGQAAPSFSAFSTARGAAPRVYEVIDRASEIDPLSADGEVPTGKAVGGEVAFRGVTFNYESRAAEGADPVLRDLNLVIRPGTTHALVGASGCGKSSTMALIERFYDPQGGVVTLDGTDVSTLNVAWLRAQMGYVGQMPTLFRGTIRENIKFGAAVDFDGATGSRTDVTDEAVVAAAKLANAHDFIVKLPEGYDTKLGDRGALLSGGQKQRVCIARAVVRNPPILLLDEATSALDSRSESIVQEALERASKGRTTILIAHRLSTVRNADVISVFQKGEIVETGTHDELVARPGGVYHELIELQRVVAQRSEEANAETGEDAADVAAAAASVGPGVSVSKTAMDSLEGDGAKTDDDGDADSKAVDVDPGVVGRAFKLNKSEAWLMVLGCIGAAMSGASWPVSALVFSEVVAVLQVDDNEKDIIFWSLMYILVGAMSLIGNVLQLGMLGMSGERMTRRLRSQSFRAILRQEIGFFDREENSVGALTTRLATDSSYVKGLCGDQLGVSFVVLSTIVAGLIVSFTGCWRLALVVLFMMPVMAGASWIQLSMMTGFDSGSKKEFVAAGGIASEAVDNIRTVTSLGVQDVFIDRYNDGLVTPQKNGAKSALVSGLAFGFGEFFMFAIWAVAFWVGSLFMERGQCDFPGIMKAVTGLLFAGFSLGQASMFAPNIAASKVSATHIFRLLDRESEINPATPGKSLASASGKVEMVDGKFEYPTRPDVAVLRGLNLAVSPGKTLALAGGSGCGKSTVVALLERFYDLRDGHLRLDDEELRELDLQNARSHLALVQQEPDLFNRTIKSNISYGLAKDGSTPVSDDVIVRAAEAANAHGFISELPLGYDTPVGERGGAMSGGMKQRIAIARALVRNPKVLILDESTSALDAVSSAVVQDALDAASADRTTVVVAHRLSTIKDADAIAVMSRGKVVELGTHEELMAKNGAYAELVQHQITDEAAG